MTNISNKLNEELFEQIPDFLDWSAASCWIHESQKRIQQFTVKEVVEKEIAYLEWNQIKEKEDLFFGLYPHQKWRKFVLSVFLADLVSYAERVDQVSFERLLFVMHAFPQGFRTWWIKLDTWTPVGYTGWYPMLESTFEIFEKMPHKLKNRMVVPNTKELHPYLYLFNFSLIPQLKKSALSKLLIKKFGDDIKAYKASGLACIAVSDDGARIAGRFDMSYSGNLTLDGSIESVYTKRFYG